MIRRSGNDRIRLILVNPNTSAATTAAMLDIARDAAPAGVAVSGETAASGSRLITTEAELAAAATAVEDVVRRCDDAPDGVIVSAFGDPGLEAARKILRCPVTGIAEAGMAEAAESGRRFAVATTTPGLVAAIGGIAERYGHARNFLGIFLTPGRPDDIMADPDRLSAALLEACREAIRAGAEAVVIGGGPLAVAARTIAPLLPVPIVEPIPAAIRLAVRRARTSGDAAPP